jgi:hypothetical protein
VFLGIVTRGQQVNGEIFVKVQNGFEINELHDVLIGSGYSSTPADNDLLAYDTASGLWKNQTAAQAGLLRASDVNLTTFEGAWTVPVGTHTRSFTVDWNRNYIMWVRGNIPNGIIVWNARVSITNSNVPIIGDQYAWYYASGNNLVLNSIPNQIIGTNGSIINNAPPVSDSNTFSFGITNNSGSDCAIQYGYIKL